MSLYSEESPVCDLKMDISGSCSSESPANTSPDVCQKMQPTLPYLESDPDDGLRIPISLSGLENINKMNSELRERTPVTRTSNILDNRQGHGQSLQLISVHTHPLMTPDDPHYESDDIYIDKGFKEVPLQSPLRLSNPLTANKPTTPSPNRHVRLQLLDNTSAVSSDSEADLSQYQANVEPLFQSVSLVTKANGSFSKHKREKSHSCSNIDGNSSEEAVRPRQPSIESLSVRSFDELDGMSHFMSRSSSASLIEGGPINNEEGMTANGRNCQTVVLADGTTREIDMKVIEPYKRVLSHGGYLKDDCQNAILVFSSCFLPDRSRADYRYVMDSLFLYVLKTLEQLVTEDYVLLYLHGGACKSNVPSFPWLKRCYQMLDRRLRKSLKNVYMVHPTFWLKSLVWMSRPFISSKFWRKLVYVKNLEELYTLVPSVERQAVPEKVKSYDVAHFKK